MMKHFRYLSYVLRHKWFVFIECYRLGIPWRGLVHDLSKFRPSEWFPYVEWFYGVHGSRFNGGFAWEFDAHNKASDRFDVAWLYHQRRNPHHWQFWHLIQDTAPSVTLQMPDVYIREMVADWIGAGMAMGNGRDDARLWYLRGREKMLLHEQTEKRVRQLLGLPE